VQGAGYKFQVAGNISIVHFYSIIEMEEFLLWYCYTAPSLSYGVDRERARPNDVQSGGGEVFH
jgi:hypothetical protein